MNLKSLVSGDNTSGKDEMSLPRERDEVLVPAEYKKETEPANTEKEQPEGEEWHQESVGSEARGESFPQWDQCISLQELQPTQVLPAFCL